MLSKIQKIRSIGNYDDYQASGDVSLKKFIFSMQKTELEKQHWHLYSALYPWVIVLS